MKTNTSDNFQMVLPQIPEILFEMRSTILSLEVFSLLESLLRYLAANLARVESYSCNTEP